MATYRTREEKVGDAKFAFDALRQELSSEALRNLISTLSAYPAPAAIQEGDDADVVVAKSKAIEAYAALVHGSMPLAQIAAANDRAALQAAVTLMNNSVGRSREED